MANTDAKRQYAVQKWGDAVNKWSDEDITNHLKSLVSSENIDTSNWSDDDYKNQAGWIAQQRDPAVIAQNKRTAEQAELKGKLGGIENFSANYAKDNPYKLDTNSQELQSYRRIAQSTKAATGAALGQQLAQRGVTDSGNATRNLTRMNQQFATGEQGALSSEDLRQKSEYLGTKADVFKEKMSGYQFASQASQQAYDEAMTNYWQNIALEQQKAANAWQQKETEEQQGWDRFFGIANLGLNIFTGLSSLFKGSGGTNALTGKSGAAASIIPQTNQTPGGG
jgi:hypothetical protein